MKLDKFLQFVKGFYLRDNKFATIIECAYQKDRTAIADLGTIEDLRALQDKLAEMEIFWMNHQK